MIRIKLRHDGDVFETLLLEDRRDIGPEIRPDTAADSEADRFVAVDVPTGHCDRCKASMDDRFGLSEDEAERILRWRDAAKMSPDERQDEGLTAADLGVILDKICVRIGLGDEDCDSDATRIVIDVEPTP